MIARRRPIRAGLPGEPATMRAQARLTGRQMIRLCARRRRIGHHSRSTQNGGYLRTGADRR
jgi:hypothetical protein